MAEIKTRPIGKALFGVNFEPTGQAPLDARLVVENMETLLANETYVDRGNNFYEGMPVIVKQGKSGKSELWVLIDGSKVTEEAGWQRLDADGVAIDGDVGKAIEIAINKLDSTVGTTTVDIGKHVAVEVAQVDGKLTEITVTENDIASATELTNTIDKIGEGFDATNTVANAIAKESTDRATAITNAINALDKGDNIVDGEFVDSVSEANGIITVTRKAVASDKVTAKAVTAADAVTVEEGTVASQIVSLAKSLKTVEGNAAKYEVEKVTTNLPTNVEARYQVVSYVGTKTDGNKTKVGEFIDIPKDGQLKNVEVTKNAKNEPTVIKFTYVLGDGGEEKVVEVDLGKAIFESEIGNGLQTDSSTGVISVKKDAASETFLTVSADGVKLSGVQAAINKAVAGKNVSATGDEYINANADGNKVSVSADVQPLTIDKRGDADSTIAGVAQSLVDGAEVADKVASFTNARIREEIAKLDATIGETTVAGDKHVAVQVVEADGKITGVNVNENDIASAGTLGTVKQAQEANTALLTGIPTDKTVKVYVDEAVAGAKAAATKVAKAADAAHLTVTKDATAADGSVTYTIGETNIASADALAAEVSRATAAEDKIEASVGLDGNGSFTAPTGKNYINGATSVMNAVEKLDAKLFEVVDDGVIDCGVYAVDSTPSE